MIRILIRTDEEPSTHLAIANGKEEAKAIKTVLEALYKCPMALETLEHTLQNTSCHLVNLGDYATWPPFCKRIKNNQCCCEQCCTCGG